MTGLVIQEQEQAQNYELEAAVISQVNVVMEAEADGSPVKSRVCGIVIVCRR